MKKTSLVEMETLEFCQDYANNFLIPFTMEFGRVYYLNTNETIHKENDNYIQAVYQGTTAEIEIYEVGQNTYMRLGENKLIFTIDGIDTMYVPLSGMPIYNTLKDAYNRKEKEIDFQCINFKKALRKCIKDKADITFVKERETYKLTRYVWSERYSKAMETTVTHPKWIILDKNGLHFDGEMKFDTNSKQTREECELARHADKIDNKDQAFLDFLSELGVTL